MVPRHVGRDSRKREDDSPPPWVIYIHDHMATDSPQPSWPTNDINDHSQYGPHWSVTWRPTPGVIPSLGSQYFTTNTLVTSTINTKTKHASSEPTATVTAIAVIPKVPSQSTSTVAPFEGGSTGDTQRKEQSNHLPVYAAAGAVPVVVITIIGFVVFFCMRKRRKQRQIAATQTRVKEMQFQQSTVRAYMAPAVPVSRAPSYTSHTDIMQHPMSPPPVILGPISAGSNGNYMTGIDTSDMSTRNERTGLGDPFADGNSLQEEPPPPYKPRSFASPNGSLRIPRSSMSVSSQHSHNLQGQRFQPLQNPFEDPREDDTVSDLSGPTLQRDIDNMSVVSDLSYQHDPQVGRRAT